VFPIFFDGFLPFFGIENPPSLIFLHLVVLCVWTFAILYFLASKNLPKAKILALVASIAKILFFLIIFIYFLLNLTLSISVCNWIAALLLSVDGIQGAMYLDFYRNYQNFEKIIENAEKKGKNEFKINFHFYYW
jgi:hypothetical protein